MIHNVNFTPYTEEFTHFVLLFGQLLLTGDPLETGCLNNGAGEFGVRQGSSSSVGQNEPSSSGSSWGQTTSRQGNVVLNGAVNLSAANLSQTPHLGDGTDTKTLGKDSGSEGFGTSVGEGHVIDLVGGSTGSPGTSNAGSLRDAQLAVGVNGSGCGRCSGGSTSRGR